MPKLFTSESVSFGHPDKLADSISDSILDAILTEDPDGRVAVETLVSGNKVVIAGEYRSTFIPDFEAIARQRILDVGYNDSRKSFDGKTCEVIVAVNPQSQDIAEGVDNSFEKRNNTSEDERYDELGAGDQGLVFGGAVSGNKEYLPLPILLSHRIIRKLESLHHQAGDNWLLYPDAKTQVTVAYENGVPIGIDTVVLSTQHAEEAELEWIRSFIIENVILPVLEEHNAERQEFGLPPLDYTSTKYLINPTGRFVIGGPLGDAGLTGRKIIVDTYGGYFRHGGGAFCFAAGTIVKTAEGHKNIEDVKPGDFVWTKDENDNSLILKPVQFLIENTKEESEQLLELELDSGEVIKVTENHEIYTQRGWVPAGKLTPEDAIEDFSQLSTKKIESIKKVDKEVTYDLNIKDNHNYFVGSSEILVHNSGKDYTKVDRSAAYAARWVAKNLVAAGYASKVEIQIAYAIGVARPVSISVESFGTGIVSDEVISAVIDKVFDLRPLAIREQLDLSQQKYLPTATGGHFGREATEDSFSWERLDKVSELQDELANILEYAG